MKKALITGVTGQDGAYLSQLLLEKGYEVHGIKRRSSLFNTDRIDKLFDEYTDLNRFKLHFGDMTDSSNIIRLIQEISPDEIYNLAAQSHVQVSFETPEYTANADAIGTLRILEAIRILGLVKDVKFYQASTSEMYGLVQEIPQTESTPFYPRSPYGVAKLYGHWITKNYREAYDIFGCSGILFNHESPMRGETFISRKTTIGVANYLKNKSVLQVGNLDAERDWGHAKDFVKAMWLMLQLEKPDDFVIATGIKRTVRELIEKSFKVVDIEIDWQGEKEREKGFCNKTGDKIVEINERYYRPSEVDLLIGDPTKAKEKLNWSPEITFDEMINEMVNHDIKEAGI
ncbi:MAG: GDP-mannose 4,6-dehydratase [Rickettsiales bacterium]|nr:GDP-mannose 4,6-dehydratase [Rickettsiales bacterium]